MTIILGEEKLVFQKRTWTLDNEEKGLRYGENPDQPAALYALKEGSITCGGLTWRGPGNGIVSALTESQMIQAGKHPGKTNLTDVDNGANILQYLTERPAAVILKHNNPSGAAWSNAGVAVALEKAFWCDRIAAFGGAVVVNRPFTREAAEIVAANYFEVVAAPAFEEGVVEILKGRKNLRIMNSGVIWLPPRQPCWNVWALCQRQKCVRSCRGLIRRQFLKAQGWMPQRPKFVCNRPAGRLIRVVTRPLPSCLASGLCSTRPDSDRKSKQKIAAESICRDFCV